MSIAGRGSPQCAGIPMRGTALPRNSGMNPHERALFVSARALLPSLAATESSTRHAREVPAKDIQALRDASLIRILQPRRFGGLQGSARILSRIVEELALGSSAAA